MKIIMWQVVVLNLTKIVFVFPTLYSGRLFFLKLRVHIKDNDNSPHGKFHRFLFPFSSKFPDLNFAPYVLYIYLFTHVVKPVRDTNSEPGFLW